MYGTYNSEVVRRTAIGYNGNNNRNKNRRRTVEIIERFNDKRKKKNPQKFINMVDKRSNFWGRLDSIGGLMNENLQNETVDELIVINFYDTVSDWRQK